MQSIRNNFEGHVYQDYFIINILQITTTTLYSQIFQEDMELMFYSDIEAFCYVAQISTNDCILLRKKKDYLITMMEPNKSINLSFFNYGQYEVYFNGPIEGLVFG